MARHKVPALEMILVALGDPATDVHTHVCRGDWALTYFGLTADPVLRSQPWLHGGADSSLQFCSS